MHTDSPRGRHEGEVYKALAETILLHLSPQLALRLLEAALLTVYLT